MKTRIASFALAGGFVLAACGSVGGGSAGADIALPEPAAGPVPQLEVDAAAQAASPLPEVSVRQLNGDGGWRQLKNELPAEQPLLVWFWAPH